MAVPLAQPFGAVNPPIVRSSTFTYPTAAEGAARFAGAPGLLYGRLQNPTVEALEMHIAELEGAEGAVCTSSGMGAIHIALMSLLKPGSRVVTDHCVYGCTHSLLQKLAGWGIELVSIQSYDAEALKAAIGDRVDVVFLESPMNPTTRIVDIQQAAKWTHEAGGKLIIDNTFATPIAQKPLMLGADLIVHSLTKAINGHSDLLAGAVVGSQEMLGEVRGWLKDAGPVMDAETASMCLRGARTLPIRIAHMNQSASTIAHALVKAGYHANHTSLPTHPDHELAGRQMPLGCHVVTIEMGTPEAAMACMDQLQVFQRAVSLGGFESLASHPASTTHACIPEDIRASAGITPGLIRLSIGLEPTEELQADLLQALSAAAHVQSA